MRLTKDRKKKKIKMRSEQWRRIEIEYDRRKDG